MWKKLKKKIRELTRKPYDFFRRRKLNNKDFSIICSNCVGGVIYHNLGMRFMSPTVNLYMSSTDFVKFLKDLKYYLEIQPDFVESDRTYPVCRIDDITLYCVHYLNENDFLEKWNERKNRINWNNLFVIMTQRDGCTYQDLKNFDELPYKNKIVFTYKEYPEFKSSYHIKNTKEIFEGQECCLPLTNYIGPSGFRIIDKFDYIKWFNEVD